MSTTTKFGIYNGWANGNVPGEYFFNDTPNLIDNQLGGIIDYANIEGVISGWTLDETLAVITVAAGEGWIADAHCLSASAQAISGLTANTTNYVWAQLITAETNRASASYRLGTVQFVATTTDTAPSNSILIGSGVMNAGGTAWSSVNNSPATSNAQRKTVRLLPDAIALMLYELLGSFVVSGFTLTPTGGTLSETITAGIAYVKGYRVYLPAMAKTFTNSKDTYVDLDKNGVLHYTEVANGAGAPAVYSTVDSIRLMKVVATGGAVTSCTDLRKMQIAGTKLETEARVNYAKSRIFNIDNGSGTTIDDVILVPNRAITITAARIVYVTETAGTVAGANVKIGTAVGGEQIVAATAYTDSATVGAKTDLTIVSGAVAADGMVAVRHTGIAATAAGEAFVEIEYTVNDQT